MSKRTRKVGIAARWGSRYGVKVRRSAAQSLKKSKASYRCPSCHYDRVRRKSAGIWRCHKCSHTFAGGAWQPYTRASEANARILRRAQEGSTTADMALLAREAALAAERRIAEDSESEE